MALPIKVYNSNWDIVIFKNSFVAIKFTSKLRCFIFLGILNLNLPIQWLLIWNVPQFESLMQYLQLWWVYIIIWGVHIINVNGTTLSQYMFVLQDQVIEYCHFIATMKVVLRWFLFMYVNNECFFFTLLTHSQLLERFKCESK